MVGPGGAGLAIVIAQPLSFETARRLRLQAEQERTRGSATCQAVVGVVSFRRPLYFCRPNKHKRRSYSSHGSDSRGYLMRWGLGCMRVEISRHGLDLLHFLLQDMNAFAGIVFWFMVITQTSSSVES